MDQKLFRKSSIERVSSPEQLNDYIRVTNPGVWLVLAAIIILLIGACIWGIFGRLETKLTTDVQVSEGEASLLIPEAEAQQVESGMQVIIDGKEYRWGEEFELPDGVYTAEIVLESISPMSFILN